MGKTVSKQAVKLAKLKRMILKQIKLNKWTMKLQKLVNGSTVFKQLKVAKV